MTSTPFEAVLLRYVPDEGTGEQLNVGVAMRTLDGHFFDVALVDSWTRITAAFPATHAPTVRAAFLRLARGLRDRFDEEHFPLTSLSQEVAALVSCDGAVRCSPVLEGTTTDAAATFRRLMARHVEAQQKPKAPRVSRTDEEVKKVLLAVFDRHGSLTAKLQPRTLKSPMHKFEMNFEHCWKNGKWNCVHAVSLDLADAHEIQEKANGWIGRTRVMEPSRQDAQLVLFVGLPPADRADARDAAVDAVAALGEQVTGEAILYLEEQADELATRVEKDLSHAAE
jgi:hypothetical protein